MGSETANSGFIKSAEKLDQFPDGTKAEIAILGRSNAGKSTLINSLLKKEIAFVSKTPGKTRLLNFYDFGKRGRIVDFPGYGYAQISREDTKAWTEMVEGYLSSRPNLVGALLLVDIKRPLTEDETNLINFLKVHNTPYLLIATKSDKLSKAELQRQMKNWNMNGVIAVSSQQHQGIEELRKLIIKTWIEPWPKSLQ
jgi:GTP-binding protein